MRLYAFKIKNDQSGTEARSGIKKTNESYLK
jgi:hypothetical protein